MLFLKIMMTKLFLARGNNTILPVSLLAAVLENEFKHLQINLSCHHGPEILTFQLCNYLLCPPVLNPEQTVPQMQ